MVLAGLIFGGAEGGVGMLVYAGVYLGFNVVVGILALFIAAAVLDIDFGMLNTAFLKLGAVFAAPVAVGMLIPIPIIDLFASLIVYWMLLAWLFELDGRDLVICVLIPFVVRLVARVALGFMFAGL